MNVLSYAGVISVLVVAVFSAYQYRTAPGAGQSRRASLAESWVNVLIGFAVSYALSAALFPLVAGGHGLGHMENFWMTCVFTAVSVIRSFVVRRYFNARIAQFFAGHLSTIAKA
jgi:predicted Co/Zn/Cd cation transporter (cation efflux family)